MLALEIHKLAMLGGDRLLVMSWITTATDLKEQKIKRKKAREKKCYSVRCVISIVYQVEGTFLKKKDFVSMSLGCMTPHYYAIQ